MGELCSWCRGWTQCPCLANSTCDLKMFTTVLCTSTLNSSGRKQDSCPLWSWCRGWTQCPCLANCTCDLKMFTTVLCTRCILVWRTIRQVCCRLGPSWRPPVTTPYARGILSPRWPKLQATNATSTAAWVLLYFTSYQVEVVFSVMWRIWSGFIVCVMCVCLWEYEKEEDENGLRSKCVTYIHRKFNVIKVSWDSSMIYTPRKFSETKAKRIIHTYCLPSVMGWMSWWMMSCLFNMQSCGFFNLSKLSLEHSRHLHLLPSMLFPRILDTEPVTPWPLCVKQLTISCTHVSVSLTFAFHACIPE